MNIPDELKEVLVSTPDTLGGAVRFVGTRVHLQLLLDTLEDGGSVAEFVRDYPDVMPEMAQAVIRWQQHEARKVFGLAS